MTSIAGIPFDIEHARVLPELARSTRAALVSRLHSYLIAGDTVRVSAYQNCPSIVGRIVFGDGPLLFTERINNFVYQMWRMNQQLLTKVGKVGGWVPIKLSLDEDVFNFFKQLLIQVGGDNISITTVGKEMKHGILHHNLSLETTLVSNTKIRIQTLNFEGIDAFKSLISQRIGIGVKRKLQSALCAPLSA